MTVTKEEVKVRGSELAGRIKHLLHEGNVRRVIVKDSHGRTVLEVPVTFGVVAFVAAPVVTAAAALAAVAAEWKLQIERAAEPDEPAPPAAPTVPAELPKAEIPKAEPPKPKTPKPVQAAKPAAKAGATQA
ncbi:DUF4342 domain-containing protein [Actinomadura sp. ATCC 31491]|uniref:DUF4342 domain-containing protein n=1 Tax=Actinomadura luzonensis TaxID=2805427 RepID=A0ABT0G4D9_9ACTN|nr:DUF4342 domain-containing protein [Actinomadura luzonensis]MCK2218986.1 DUF4342 domain-containing protein [Actinomadura luzonensis]